MIHCLTSSYSRDFERASFLNERLIKQDVTHHIFVEQKDFELFKGLEQRGKTMIHIKPDGGEGGLGRSGTMVRFPCYKVMQTFIKEGDSYVQLDSDVIIDSEIITHLACSTDEVKGFFNPDYPVHLERPESAPRTDVRFCHLSGMTICAGWRVFHKSIPEDESDMLDIIHFMMDEGFTPSEDIILSYLLQRQGHKLTNLFASYDREFNIKGDVEIRKMNGEFGTTLFKESV
jgi:hypothetical protein